MPHENIITHLTITREKLHLKPQQNKSWQRLISCHEQSCFATFILRSWHEIRRGCCASLLWQHDSDKDTADKHPYHLLTEMKNFKEDKFGIMFCCWNHADLKTSKPKCQSYKDVWAAVYLLKNKQMDRKHALGKKQQQRVHDLKLKDLSSWPRWRIEGARMSEGEKH